MTNTLTNVVNTNSLISVITPNFNGCNFIRRAVESVRKQNYLVEHIIVDDCSTDGSWKLLQDLAKKYDWLKIYRLSENSGPLVARNHAIDVANGRFLAFLDVDDFWLPNKLQIQINFMLNSNCSLSFSDYRFISEDGYRIGRRIKGFNIIGWHLHHMTRYLGCLTVVLDRHKYPGFKFPIISQEIRAEDFLAWSKWIQQYGAALRCPHDLARYSVVSNSRSSEKFKASSSVWHVYRDLEHISFINSLFYFLCYGAGVLWKRYWNRPFFNRQKVDIDYHWSLIKKINK